MKPGTLRALTAASALAIALTTFGCSTEEEEPRILASPVFAVPAEEVDIIDRIEATGELLAKDDASVAAQVGGAITETLIEEGSSVAAGDVVVGVALRTGAARRVALPPVVERVASGAAPRKVRAKSNSVVVA